MKGHPVVSSIFEKVDPMETVIMILGGTAAANGIIPPMTALLGAFSKTGTSDWQGLPTGNWIDPKGNIDWFTILFGTNPPDWAKGFMPTPEQAKDPTWLEQHRKTIGLFCSGAIEAMIMYKLVSNPETFRALVQLPGQALTAAQGLAKVIPV